MTRVLLLLLPPMLLSLGSRATPPPVGAAPDTGPHAAAAATALPVVFVPGIAGSMLVDPQGAEYWPAAGYSGHEKLTLYASQAHPTLHASDVITEAKVLGIHISAYDSDTYGPFLKFLRAHDFVQYRSQGNPALRTTAGCDLGQAASRPNLFVFPYDWRLSNAVNASALADYVGCVRRFYPGSDVNIVTHSMGSLVARRYILDHPDAHHVQALITFAAPWLGAGKLGWVMETGQFVSFVWGSTLVDVVGSFTGAHELMTSQAWYDLGGPPAIVEDGQDLNKNGISNEQYSYADLVQYMDKFKGKEGFLPGTANLRFHGFSGSRGAQDDWRGDSTGIRYFHILGAGGAPDTISQVIATTFLKCAKNYSTCDFSTWEYPEYAVGDQTVSTLSTSRNGGARGNYNAPGAAVYTCQATGVNSANVSHTAMLSNASLQFLLLQYLAQANGAPAQPPPDPRACGRGGAVSEPPMSDAYHQLVIDGATDVEVTEGGSTPDPAKRYLDEVAQHPMSPTATRLLLASGEYTVTFKTQAGPTYIEWLYGTDGAPVDAVRYLDVELPANKSAVLRLRDGSLEALHYDGDDNGSWESAAAPTFALEGSQAADETAPQLAIHALLSPTGARVTITARDDAVGVDDLLYSLDGEHFQPYVGPFVVDPAQVRTIDAFAEDRVGNRSTLSSYRVPAGQVFLPSVHRAVQGADDGLR